MNRKTLLKCLQNNSNNLEHSWVQISPNFWSFIFFCNFTKRRCFYLGLFLFICIISLFIRLESHKFYKLKWHSRDSNPGLQDCRLNESTSPLIGNVILYLLCLIHICLRDRVTSTLEASNQPLHWEEKCINVSQCVNSILATFACNSIFKWAILGPFFFIFVFSKQLTVNKCWI